MHKVIRSIPIVLMGVLLSLGPSLASAHTSSVPTSAQTLSVHNVKPDTKYGPYAMCNYREDENFCWISNGVGNQLTINTGNYGFFTWIADGTYDGDPVYEFQNNAGHCVYVNGEGHLNLVSATCDSSSGNEKFAEVYEASAVGWFNPKFSGYVYVDNVEDGDLVYAGQTGGNYYNWVYCSGSTCSTGHGPHK